MTLKQLEYVCKVAELKNISLAANELFIAQPSLTHAISELENEMNITIFIRTNKGVKITKDGETFISYAKNVLEQANLLDDKFKNTNTVKPRFSVSAQHYSFVVNAFVDVIKEFDADTYDFTLKETKTHEIIDDVTNLKSEIGILYLSNSNQDVLTKIFKNNNLEFIKLFTAEPHIFIDKNHPLSKKEKIYLQDLDEFPYLSFEQGNNNSFYYSEELLPTIDRKKNIKVSDRATLFNLAVGLNGYTVSSGVISEELNGGNIISKRLYIDENMVIGYIKQKNMSLSKYATSFIKNIKLYIRK